jgi:hypothetical protein
MCPRHRDDQVVVMELFVVRDDGRVVIVHTHSVVLVVASTAAPPSPTSALATPGAPIQRILESEFRLARTSGSGVGASTGATAHPSPASEESPAPAPSYGQWLLGRHPFLQRHEQRRRYRQRDARGSLLLREGQSAQQLEDYAETADEAWTRSHPLRVDGSLRRRPDRVLFLGDDKEFDGMKANQEAVARRLVGSGMDVVYMNTECSSVRRPRETHHYRMQHRGALVRRRDNVFPVPPPFNPFWLRQRQLANGGPGSEIDVATTHVGSDGGVTMQRMHKAGATLRSTCFGFRVPDGCQNPDFTIKVVSWWPKCVMNCASWELAAENLLCALQWQQHEFVVATMWDGTSRPRWCRTTCHDSCQGSPTRTTLPPW